ncbi:MAG: hypothetical protein R3313_00545 [Candidatus Saccharimonadales bacterium]|nr:hypothetical protein [Candidatus Saccharimonadales bacterium]
MPENLTDQPPDGNEVLSLAPDVESDDQQPIKLGIYGEPTPAPGWYQDLLDGRESTRQPRKEESETSETPNTRAFASKVLIHVRAMSALEPLNSASIAEEDRNFRKELWEKYPRLPKADRIRTVQVAIDLINQRSGLDASEKLHIKPELAKKALAFLDPELQERPNPRAMASKVLIHIRSMHNEDSTDTEHKAEEDQRFRKDEIWRYHPDLPHAERIGVVREAIELIKAREELESDNPLHIKHELAEEAIAFLNSELQPDGDDAEAYQRLSA